MASTCATAIMLFARYPEAGRVKTRLIPHLGADRACRLHRAMLSRMLQDIVQVNGADAQLWFADAPADISADYLSGCAVERQCGDDLGQRLARAFQSNFSRGYSHVLVCGSDCPALTVQHYLAMQEALVRHDAVFIPALDGGYVALGLRRYSDALFDDMPWGDANIFELSVEKLRRLGWNWHSLDPLPDIDCAEDLAHLQGLNLNY